MPKKGSGLGLRYGETLSSSKPCEGGYKELMTFESIPRDNSVHAYSVEGPSQREDQIFFGFCFVIFKPAHKLHFLSSVKCLRDERLDAIDNGRKEARKARTEA